jgi:hypothetical protein
LTCPGLNFSSGTGTCLHEQCFRPVEENRKLVKLFQGFVYRVHNNPAGVIVAILRACASPIVYRVTRQEGTVVRGPDQSVPSPLPYARRRAKVAG